MSTQRALVVQEVGKPIVVAERPIPEPKEGEIRIKVTVCGCKSPMFLLSAGEKSTRFCVRL